MPSRAVCVRLVGADVLGRPPPAHQNRIGIATKRAYQNLPPTVEELERKSNLPLGQIGTLWMGEKGILWQHAFGSACRS